jgi:O-antigen chain-terminating methyltransferase
MEQQTPTESDPGALQAELWRYQPVDRVAEGRGLLKRLLARLLRMVTAPQAAFNAAAARRIEQLDARLSLLVAENAELGAQLAAATRQIEQLAAAASQVEQLDARLSLVVAENAELRAQLAAAAPNWQIDSLWRAIEGINERVEQRAQQADLSRAFDELARAFAAIEDRAGREEVPRLWAEIETLHRAVADRAGLAAMQELARAIEDRAGRAEVEQLYAAIDQRASQQQVVDLWARLGELGASIEAQSRSLWDGIAERDRQIGLTTSAAQELNTRVAAVETALRETRARLLGLGEQVGMLSTAATPPAPTPSAPATPSAATAAEERDPILEAAYLRFQRQFRGDEADLRARQQRYVDLLSRSLAGRARPVVLDVACGDGLFVEALAARGWDARGVDLNPAMVRHGRGRGLAISEGDAIAALAATPPASLDAVTAFQFIEHLQPAALSRFLVATARALRPGGLLLLETIYPRTIKSLHWYFLDLSHSRLVFPEMLGILVETIGLRPIEWKPINPVADHERLPPTGHPATDRALAQLNDFLYGAQDYYYLAQRP